MIKDYGETNFVTGLRAIAATMVIIVHTGALNELGWIGKNITRAGITGVYVFFVIAGFSITESFNRECTYARYLIRRVTRVLPAYAVVTSVTFAMIVWGG